MTEKQKLILVGLITGTITALLIGFTFAYWTWESTSTQRTAISFTVGDGFSCSADGGGNITSSDVQLMPTECTDTAHAIKRTVKVNTTQDDGMAINLYMNLKVDSIGTNLANSENFRYALTRESTSCRDGVVNSGNFKNATTNTELKLLDEKIYLETTSNDTYYLWIWLDKEETNNNTQNQTFNFSLSGSCSIHEFIPSQTTITLDKSTYSVDEDVTVTANLPADATGSVTFTVGTNSYNAQIQAGIASYTITDRILSGEHTITATYSGDTLYSSSSSTTSFTVNKLKLNMSASLNTDITEGQNKVFTITYSKDATGTFTLTINCVRNNYTGTYSSVTDGIISESTTSKKVKIIVPGLEAGKYTASLTYSGDEKYSTKTTEGNFTVFKASSME